MSDQANPNAISLHPIILVASITAATSIVVFCVALVIAYKKGHARFKKQMEDMQMVKGTKSELDIPQGQPPNIGSPGNSRSKQYNYQNSQNPLPTPSQLDEESIVSLSVVDTKSYRPGDTTSVVSMESYSYSLDGYAPSIANSSTVYGY